MKIELEFNNEKEIQDLHSALTSCYYKLLEEQEEDAYMVELLTESNNPSRKESLEVQSQLLKELNAKITAIEKAQNQLWPHICGSMIENVRKLIKEINEKEGE
jgi:uncharacterized protein with gpF-like domain